MTATERLRQLLDERGVEYRLNEHTKVFEWHFDGTDGEGSAHATEVKGGINIIACSLTPEQAVEATLGRGTCGNASDFPKYEFVCSACGGRLDILDEFDNPTVQHDDGSFGPRYCPSCGRKAE